MLRCPGCRAGAPGPAVMQTSRPSFPPSSRTARRPYARRMKFTAQVARENTEMVSEEDPARGKGGRRSTTRTKQGIRKAAEGAVAAALDEAWATCSPRCSGARWLSPPPGGRPGNGGEKASGEDSAGAEAASVASNLKSKLKCEKQNLKGIRDSCRN